MYIGIDIGGTKSSVVLGNENAEIIEKIKFQTTEKEETIQNIMEAVEKVDGPKVKAIGISCGGPLDGEKGIILSPPNLPGWDNVRIVPSISSRFKKPVFLQNDADAGALAEWHFGSARGYDHIIFLTFGTGFGAGLILNGRLYTGASNNAGEIGHVRLFEEGHTGYGKKGSVEGYCSGGGIAQYQMGSAKELSLKANAGEQDAIKLFEEIGENLGRSLAVLVDILNPQIIVIGSIYTKSEGLLKTSMLKKLKEEALNSNFKHVVIKPSLLQDNIGDVAALCVAMDGVGRRKCGYDETIKRNHHGYTENLNT